MSSVLWDVFTGSAPYREILLRTLKPAFPATLAWNLVAGNVSRGKASRVGGQRMSMDGLGKIYGDQQVVIRQGEIGDCMFVIQKGRVEVIREANGSDFRVAVLEEGDIFGEMAIFEKEFRSATVRALGEARVLTVDKRTFLRRVQEDPSLAFNLARLMSKRIRRLNLELEALRGGGAPNAQNPAACGTPGTGSAPPDDRRAA
jgi:CRP-like cAMP-binding protein